MKRTFKFEDGKTRTFVIQKEFGKFVIYEKTGFLSDKKIGDVPKESKVMSFLEGKYGEIKEEIGSFSSFIALKESGESLWLLFL